MVFFKIRKNKISHVGLYLGNNLFLHATTKAGVIVSDLDEEYYRRRYYGAGRDPKAPTCTPLYLPTTP
jgi:lipoprotein Spr